MLDVKGERRPVCYVNASGTFVQSCMYLEYSIVTFAKRAVRGTQLSLLYSTVSRSSGMRIWL